MTYVCPCCLLRGMRCRLDRKGRPFFQCVTCSAIIFPRGGHLGLAQAAAAMRLLDQEANLTWARAEGFARANTESVAAMLSASPAAIAPAVAVAEPQAKAAG